MSGIAYPSTHEDIPAVLASSSKTHLSTEHASKIMDCNKEFSVMNVFLCTAKSSVNVRKFCGNLIIVFLYMMYHLLAVLTVVSSDV